MVCLVYLLAADKQAQLNLISAFIQYLFRLYSVVFSKISTLRFFSILVFALLSLIGASSFSQAQNSLLQPNAELLRSQERDRALQERNAPDADVHLLPQSQVEEKRPIPTRETPCFPIRNIVLLGDKAQEFSWLRWFLHSADGIMQDDPAAPRCLGAQTIRILMGRMQSALIDRGYITTRILVGPQNLSSGTLSFTVIPGIVERLYLNSESKGRVSLWSAFPLGNGDVVNLRDIEQGLENLKRLPSIEADIAIVPANEEKQNIGLSNLLVTWRKKSPLRITVGADNSGVPSTGIYQGNVTLFWDNPLKMSDLFYITYMRGGVPGWKGTTGGLIHYSVPYGYWLLSLNGSENFYDQTVVGWLQNYIYSGKTRTADLKLSRMMYRDASMKLLGFVGPWFKTAETFIDGHPLPIQYRRSAGFEVGITQTQTVGRLAFDVQMTYRAGTGMMGAIPQPDERFYPGISRPKFLIGEAHLTAPFSLGAFQFRYNTTLRGQWNFTHLSIQDRFSIGPRSTVRGFDGQEILMGDRGWFIRNDVGVFLGQTGQEIYLGLDYGQVGGRSTQEMVGRALAGGVIGLRGRIKQLTYDGFIGMPLYKPASLKTVSPNLAFNLAMVF
jgi:hemolysin activation/secretion protein